MHHRSHGSCHEQGGFWAGSRRGGWGFDFGPSGPNFWGGRFGGGGGGPFKGGRMFGQGDLRYVILQLLAEKPRHGYDIIKELEERFGGAYSPSPGTVYPTLAMLEDQGFAVARSEEGKKVYEITDEGRRYLAENRTVVDDLFERITSIGSSLFGEPMMEVHRAMRDLAAAVYAHAGQSTDGDKLRRIREALDKAARDVRSIWSNDESTTEV